MKIERRQLLKTDFNNIVHNFVFILSNFIGWNKKQLPCCFDNVRKLPISFVGKMAGS